MAEALRRTRRKRAIRKHTGLFKPRTRLDGAIRKLEDALTRDWKQVARQVHEFASRFHDYSPFNRWLIFSQRPDATLVKGRKQWFEEHGRVVRKGARAIHILAPKLKPGQIGRTGFFQTVKVYDVSDTEGPPFEVPYLGQIVDQGKRAAQLLGMLENWVRRSGLELKYEPPPALNELVWGATNGIIIWIRPDLKTAERLAVLAHEIAHVKLHFRTKDRGHGLFVDFVERLRQALVQELEAELTSFLLLEMFGIDSSRSAAVYLNSWEASAEKVRARAERCFLVACSVLRECEQKRYRKVIDKGQSRIPSEARAALL